MDRIRVAAGVIRNSVGEVLIGQRIVKDSYYQKWEFPGGKLEAGETPADALVRELEEELGIIVTQSAPLMTIKHDYSDRKIELYVRDVIAYTGSECGVEGQAIKWVRPFDMRKVDFLEANQPIIQAVNLPSYMLITQTKNFGVDETLKKIELLTEQDKNFILQVREKEMSFSDMQLFVQKTKDRIHNKNIKVVMNGSIEMALLTNVDGVHLTSRCLNELHGIKPDLPENFLLGVSCHNQQDIQMANKVADYAVLGSVNATPSHPDGLELGWEAFQQLADIAKLPVYAIGGMVWGDKSLAKEYGGQGVAMISDVWDTEINF